MKFFYIFILSLFSLSVMGQDLILTTDNQSIKCKIIEIKNKEIKYKKEGSDILYTSDKNSISTIILESGEVINVSNNSNQNKNNVQESHSETNSNVYNNSNEAKLMTLERKAFKTHYYYGSEKISRKQYETMTITDCPLAYEKYTRSRRLMKSYWVVAGIGLAGVLTAIPLCSLMSVDIYAPAIITGGTGLAMVITGTGLALKSNRLEKESMDIFNNQCINKKSTRVELGLSVSNRGIGMAMNF